MKSLPKFNKGCIHGSMYTIALIVYNYAGMLAFMDT